MRIPGSRVYRAFPELDRFTDEQCGRFMKATRRDWWVARLARLTIVLGVFAGTGIVGYAAALRVIMAIAPRSSNAVVTDAGVVAIVLCAIGPLVVAMVAAIFTRDAVLRRRLRTVINERGRCLGCGYSLLGAPVGADLKVLCPECGAPTEVDSALAELQQQGGGHVFRPSEQISLTLTPAERRRRRRTAVTLALALLAVPLAALTIWAWSEWRIAADARTAAAERPGAAGVAALLATLPETGDPAIDAWTEFARARTLMLQVDAAIIAAGKGELDSSGAPLAPRYGQIGLPIRDNNDDTRAETARAVALAERTIPKLREAGVFAAMTKMREGCIAAPFTIGASQPIVNVTLPEISYARQLCRLNFDRATLARNANDPVEFEDAMLSSLMMARMCDREPFMIAQLVAIAIVSQVHEQVAEALMSAPDARWLDAADRLLAGPVCDTPPTFHIEGERISFIDAAASYFANGAKVRADKRAALTAWLRDERPRRIGSYVEARDTFNRVFELAKAEVVKERYQRTPALSLEPPSDQAIVREYMVSLERYCSALDNSEVDRRGLRIMAAIERRRLKEGTYPAKLDELAPAYLTAIPSDPFGGKDYLYLRVDPANDPQRRSYILYIRGRDGADDGGNPGRFYLDALQGAPVTGVDYIINQRSR